MDYVQNILIKQLFAENVCSQGFYLVLERLLVCEVDLGKEGVVEREVLPGGGDAAEHVEPEILEPGVDDVGMGIPGLDGALVDPALEISCDFLWAKGLRMTVQRECWVGRKTGPVMGMWRAEAAWQAKWVKRSSSAGS